MGRGLSFFTSLSILFFGPGQGKGILYFLLQPEDVERRVVRSGSLLQVTYGDRYITPLVSQRLTRIYGQLVGLRHLTHIRLMRLPKTSILQIYGIDFFYIADVGRYELPHLL